MVNMSIAMYIIAINLMDGTTMLMHVDAELLGAERSKKSARSWAQRMDRACPRSENACVSLLHVSILMGKTLTDIQMIFIYNLIYTCH